MSILLNNKCIWAALHLVLLCTGHLHSLTIQHCFSDYLSYKNSVHHLRGNVLIEDTLGKMIGEEGWVFHLEEKGRQTVEKVKLKGNVQWQLVKGEQLQCHDAVIYPINFTADLQGSDSSPVTFYAEKPDQHNQMHGIYLSGLQMHVIAEREEGIKSIDVDREVEGRYGQEWQIEANQAKYSEKNGNSKATFLAMENSTDKICQARHQQDKSCLDAMTFSFSLPQRLLVAHEPNGYIGMMWKGEEKRVAVAARCLYWNQNRQSIVLEEEACLNAPMLGEVRSNRRITMYQREEGEQKQLDKIIGEGLCHCTLLDANQKEYRLFCPGSLTFDYGNDSATGLADSFEQVVIYDQNGQLRASKVDVFYSRSDQVWQVEKMILEGQVEIIDQRESRRGAIAKKAVFLPQKQRVLLEGEKKNPALFFDREQSCVMYAQKMTIQRDGQTREEWVQSKGKVRALIGEEEVHQVEKRFHDTLPSF